MKRFFPISLFLLLAVLLTGCATKPVIDPDDKNTGYVWTPSGVTEELAGNDPIEPFNRAMFVTNDFIMHWILRPVGYVYGSILPREGIKRIDMVSDNLAFPGRMISCFLQAKFAGGGTEFLRFLTNSTIGIAGIFDPADAWFGLARRPENMGHAFARWGIGPGCVLILPLSSATNPRDQVGALFDSVLDIKFIIPYAQTIAGVNRAVNSYDGYNTMTETCTDPYDMAKMGLVAMRYVVVNDLRERPMVFKDYSYGQYRAPENNTKGGQIKTAHYYAPQNPLVDTLRVGMFKMQKNDTSFWIKTSLWNHDFVTLGSTRGIRFHEESPEIRSQYWQGADPTNTLVILIPGIGTHYKGPTLRAMAEVLNTKGYSVAVLSSTMNKTFSEGAGLKFPGYVPDDVAAIRKTLGLILKDINANTKLAPKRVVVGGYSLGGLHTLHLAALEAKEDTLGVDRFVALNPPADLLYAMNRFDQFTDVSKQWTKKEFFDLAGDGLMKYFGIMNRKYPPMQPDQADSPKYQVPLSPEQAAVMAGISFRMTLRELLISAHRQYGLSQLQTPYSWWSRTDLYREIDQYNGMGYVRNFLLPEYQQKDPSATMEKLNWKSGLRSIADDLRKNPKIRVLHNMDDPILSPDDRIFLDDVLKEKLTWFDCGGHMGNLYLIEHQQKLCELLGTPGILPKKEE